jgi:hypothetical protein
MNENEFLDHPIVVSALNLDPLEAAGAIIIVAIVLRLCYEILRGRSE